MRIAWRVGEQSAVVWNRLYFRPAPANRSAVGVSHGPPNAVAAPKPTSSIRAMITLGAPGGGRIGSPEGSPGPGRWRRICIRPLGTVGDRQDDTTGGIWGHGTQPGAPLGEAEVPVSSRQGIHRWKPDHRHLGSASPRSHPRCPR